MKPLSIFSFCLLRGAQHDVHLLFLFSPNISSLGNGREGRETGEKQHTLGTSRHSFYILIRITTCFLYLVLVFPSFHDTQPARLCTSFITHALVLKQSKGGMDITEDLDSVEGVYVCNVCDNCPFVATLGIYISSHIQAFRRLGNINKKGTKETESTRIVQ